MPPIILLVDGSSPLPSDGRKGMNSGTTIDSEERPPFNNIRIYRLIDLGGVAAIYEACTGVVSAYRTRRPARPMAKEFNETNNNGIG